MILTWTSWSRITWKIWSHAPQWQKSWIALRSLFLPIPLSLCQESTILATTVHAVEWKTNFIDHALQYLVEVWETFSSHYLLTNSPPIALLDGIHRGCVSITWLYQHIWYHSSYEKNSQTVVSLYNHVNSHHSNYKFNKSQIQQILKLEVILILKNILQC